MAREIISICVPTYNGSKTINKTLDSIIKNINNARFNEEIEIILTDDCSMDDTFFILKEYADKYKYVKIFRNEKNLGMDGNFKQVALNASGKYIWFSGQDDIFLDGVVDHVINSILNNQNIDIISINFSQYLEEKSKYICESMLGLQAIYPEKINFDHDILFNNAKEYFSFFNDVPSFLPATIMRRDFWLTTNTDKYLGTYFIQYATILLNLNEAKILAITKPLIRGLIPAIGWQTDGDKLFSIQLGAMKAKFLVFNDVRNPFPKEIFLDKKRFYLRRFLRMVIAANYYKFKLSKGNKDDLKMIYGKNLYYFYFLPIFKIIKIIPHFLIKLLFSIKNFLID